MTVFICGEEPDDIWCGVYDAWISRLGHTNVRLEPGGCDRELFCEYQMVRRDSVKAEKVVDAIRRKLSENLYEEIYKAALSRDRYRCDKIYRFLIYAFDVGTKVTDMLQIPAVYEIFAMNRHLWRENDHLRGFIRFSQMRNGFLLSKIAPENDVTVLLAAHFADRMPSENWIIYDCGRKKAAVHKANAGWMMVKADSEEWQIRLSKGTDEQEFEELWKTFHRSIGIKERNNPRCQMNMLPLRFRPYMTEFSPQITKQIQLWGWNGSGKSGIR